MAEASGSGSIGKVIATAVPQVGRSHMRPVVTFQLSFRYLLILIYSFVLVYVYGILSLWWAYYGFTYLLRDQSFAYLACFVAAFPALLLAARPNTIAQVAGWILYILVFLPCMLVPLMQQSQGSFHALILFAAVFVGAILFMLIARGPVKRIQPPTVPPQFFWLCFLTLWALMMGISLYGFRDQLHFAGASDIYDQRFSVTSIATNPVIRYSLMFCANAFNPFLIAYGLHKRRWGWTLLGVIAQILLFMTIAFRATLLSPIFIAGIYFLFDRRNQFKDKLFLILLVVVVISMMPLMQFYDPKAGLLGNFLSLIYLRILMISGMTFGVYDNFFSMYPVTYFSNSAFLGHLIHYPYGDLSVGQVVGLFLVPSNSRDIMQLNANFIATDGIASIGIIGVPIMCAALAAILRVLSKFIPPHRTGLAAAAMSTFFINLSNVSMLTSLLTGGGIFLTAMVFLCPIEQWEGVKLGRWRSY